MRRWLLVAVLAAAALTLGAGEAEAWRRRRGFRSSSRRPLTQFDVCCALPIIGLIVLFGGVNRTHRRSQLFSSMHRHRRW